MTHRVTRACDGEWDMDCRAIKKKYSLDEDDGVGQVLGRSLLALGVVRLHAVEESRYQHYILT